MLIIHFLTVAHMLVICRVLCRMLVIVDVTAFIFVYKQADC